MKRITTCFLLLSSMLCFSQEAKQTEDLYGVKVGLVGAWVHAEKALSNKFTINAEIGYEGGIMYSTADKTSYILTTTFSLEPRFYYNLKRRQNKGKKTNLNAANYLAAELYYVPDFLSATNKSDVKVAEVFAVVPKYGLRRVLSKSIAFEFAFGVGYAWGENNVSGTISTLDLRFDFKL